MESSLKRTLASSMQVETLALPSSVYHMSTSSHLPVFQMKEFSKSLRGLLKFFKRKSTNWRPLMIL